MVLVEMSIAAGHLDEVTSWLSATRLEAPASAHQGCILLDIYQATDDPGTIVFVEQFETRADHDAYLAWRRERGDVDFLVARMRGDPTIRYFDLVDV